MDFGFLKEEKEGHKGGVAGTDFLSLSAPGCCRKNDKGVWLFRSQSILQEALEEEAILSPSLC